MSRQCDICGRRAQTGNNRSKSKVATKRKQGLNLQSKKIDGERVKICTKCLKTKTKTNPSKAKKMAPLKPKQSVNPRSKKKISRSRAKKQK